MWAMYQGKRFSVLDPQSLLKTECESVRYIIEEKSEDNIAFNYYTCNAYAYGYYQVHKTWWCGTCCWCPFHVSEKGRDRVKRSVIWILCRLKIHVLTQCSMDQCNWNYCGKTTGKFFIIWNSQTKDRGRLFNRAKLIVLTDGQTIVCGGSLCLKF